jgi:hypothetical protein
MLPVAVRDAVLIAPVLLIVVLDTVVAVARGVVRLVVALTAGAATVLVAATVRP